LTPWPTSATVSPYAGSGNGQQLAWFVAKLIAVESTREHDEADSGVFVRFSISVTVLPSALDVVLLLLVCRMQGATGIPEMRHAI